MKNKLLIYIPSYNRACSLLVQLTCLSHSKHNLFFDVIINDNCSIDVSGYNKVKDFCIKNDFIYYKNSINVGADANIFNGFMVSFGYDYLWILSDDDLLKNGSVDTVLHTLENDLDVLFLTHSQQNDLQISSWNQKDLLHNNIYASEGAGLISNVIYKTDFIKNSIPIGFQNIYTCFCHLSVLLDSFKSKQAKIGTLGSHLFFIPDTNLPPDNSAVYSKSYFGFVLLGETLEEPLKVDFINKYANFWNLRHWNVKAKDTIALPNSIYAKAYILRYAYNLNFFRTKLLFWTIGRPILKYVKTKATDKFKKILRTKLRIRF